MPTEIFFPAFAIGLMGAGHCLGMCGGISAALSFAIPNSTSFFKLMILLAYNLGRICSYVVIGLLAGLLGRALQPMFAEITSLPVLRLLAALMLVLMGLYVSGWWRVLTRLERVGTFVWRHLQPIGQKLLPVKSPGAAFLIGGVWGWLPCGLVYSALVFALAQGEMYAAGWAMLAFGLGTMPAIMLGGLASEKIKTLLQMTALRSAMGAALIGFGIWTAVFAFQHSGHNHHQHEHHHAGEPGMRMQ